MGSDEFIDLDAACDNNFRSVENDTCRSDCPASIPNLEEDTDSKGIIRTFEGSTEAEEDDLVQDMDLEDDLALEQPVLQESAQLVGTVSTVKSSDIQHEQDNECSDVINASNNLFINESPIAGVKRARVISNDKGPSVRIIYNSLTRQSKRKLMELMQLWSDWQADYQSSSKKSTQEPLECGEETYYPALHVGSEKSSTLSFWVDNQARMDNTEDDSVPLYDREYTLGSTLLGGSASSERADKEDSRCFNCGSYSHSLKECPKPRDNVAISNARKQHNAKRNQSAANRVQSRYYLKTPGKFDDLRAGVLGPETRECLGIGENDPPPWLHRMREIGYPPGYLDVVEDEDRPSGITIYADEEAKEECEEEGELPEKGEAEPPERKMTVEFPGINAPIPENADRWLWAAIPSRSLGAYSPNTRPHFRQQRSSDSHRGRFEDHKSLMEHRDDGCVPANSPRYNPYEYNSTPRSPHLGRSHSGRGYRSPLAYDSSPADSPRSPYPYPSPQHHSPSLEHWNNGSAYRATSPDGSSHHVKDRQDFRRHHRR